MKTRDQRTNSGTTTILKSMLLTCALIAGTIYTGYAGVNNFSGNEGIKDQLRKEITFPGFLKAKKQSTEVKVSFTVNKEGKADIVTVNTTNAELKKYVEQKMEKMIFTGTGNENEVHNINLVFKLL